MKGRVWLASTCSWKYVNSGSGAVIAGMESQNPLQNTVIGLKTHGYYYYFVLLLLLLLLLLLE